MQCHIDSLPGYRGVLAEKPTKGIKRRVWVCAEEGIAQPGLAHFADGEVLSLVERVTETHFPVPGLEVIAKLAHLATQADVEELVPVSELLTSGAGIVNAAEPNPGSHRNRRSVNNQSRVPNCERIERIRDWHTDAERASRPDGRKIAGRKSGKSVEWIGRKWHSGQR